MHIFFVILISYHKIIANFRTLLQTSTNLLFQKSVIGEEKKLGLSLRGSFKFPISKSKSSFVR